MHSVSEEREGEDTEIHQPSISLFQETFSCEPDVTLRNLHTICSCSEHLSPHVLVPRNNCAALDEIHAAGSLVLVMALFFFFLVCTMCVCEHLCMQACAYVFVYIHVYTQICMCVYTYVYINTYTLESQAFVIHFRVLDHPQQHELLTTESFLQSHHFRSRSSFLKTGIISYPKRVLRTLVVRAGDAVNH